MGMATCSMQKSTKDKKNKKYMGSNGGGYCMCVGVCRDLCALLNA